MMKFLNHCDDDERWKKSLMEFFSTKYGLRNVEWNHSIPIVPVEFRKFVKKKQEFRKSIENAHIPKFISIGPRHRGRSELQQAEGIKWRCIKHFLFRVDRDNFMKLLEKCLEEVLKLDAVVRTSYGDEINLDRYELANVMLFDGCFLSELLLSLTDSNGTSPAEKVKNMEHVLSDLMLVENQLPFIVLETLFFNLLHVELPVNTIQRRALYFFGLSDIHPLIPAGSYRRNYHFTDLALQHIRFLGQDERTRRESVAQKLQQAQHLNRCATRLQAVGITIKCLSNNKNTTVAPLSSIFQFFEDDIKFNKSSNGRIILEIPQLDITRITQVLTLWKAFIAWEIHFRNQDGPDLSYLGPFTSYAILFNDLICCTSDVQMLKNKGVIVDHSANNNRDIMHFFRSIILGVDRGRINPIFGNMFHEFNTHSSSPANYATKYIILLFHYFCKFLEWGYNLRNFFERGYNFIATLLAILTVVQTCYAIVSYHDPKKS